MDGLFVMSVLLFIFFSISNAGAEVQPVMMLVMMTAGGKHCVCTLDVVRSIFIQSLLVIVTGVWSYTVYRHGEVHSGGLSHLKALFLQRLVLTWLSPRASMTASCKSVFLVHIFAGSNESILTF